LSGSYETRNTFRAPCVSGFALILSSLTAVSPLASSRRANTLLTYRCASSSSAFSTGLSCLSAIRRSCTCTSLSSGSEPRPLSSSISALEAYIGRRTDTPPRLSPYVSCRMSAWPIRWNKPLLAALRPLVTSSLIVSGSPLFRGTTSEMISRVAASSLAPLSAEHASLLDA
jgi:hypothetical protein